MSERNVLVSIRGLAYFIGERRLLDIPELTVLDVYKRQDFDPFVFSLS